MGKRNNVIEINGRRYDAATGKPVASAPDQAVKKMEGVSKPRRISSSHNAATAKRLHRSPKKSTTLNRTSTKRPREVQSAPVIDSMTTKPSASKASLANRIPANRANRAKVHLKSATVSKFTSENAVEKAEAVASPVLRAPAQKADAAHPSVKERLIAARLSEAESAPPKKKRSVREFFAKRPKTVTVLATGASVLLLVGYITYLNIPNMALRVAAARAGFEANMPGYRPHGFKFSGPISYSPGQLTIQFDSNTDDRNYTITERETNWDSQSLLENFVKSETDLYSTFQERGLTVFIYDGSNAAWVNGGIWYTIAGDASLLNSEQLLKIATSL